MKKPFGIMMVHSGGKVFIRLMRNTKEIDEMTSACEKLHIPYNLFKQVEGMPLYYGETEVNRNEEAKTRP